MNQPDSVRDAHMRQSTMRVVWSANKYKVLCENLVFCVATFHILS